MQTTPTPKQSASLPKVARRILIAIAVLLAAYFVLTPILFAVIATRPATSVVGAPPTGFREVALTATDGTALAAWYAPPENGAVILLLHGAGGSRETMRAQAQLLAAQGFGVLALDLRGHGARAGRANLFGWAGTRDVGAAMSFLAEQADVAQTGALGSSLGAEVLLGAAASYPEIAAVVSDGATYRTLAEYQALPQHRGALAGLQHWLLDGAVRLFSGDTPPPPLLDALLSAEQTALLLIAAGNDADEIAFNTLFAEAAGARAQLWVAPDVAHTGAYARYPEEYAQRVVAFFQMSLLHDKPGVP